jgi:hypothetical protein
VDLRREACYPARRLEESKVTKERTLEAVDWASRDDTHNVARERRWWSPPSTPFVRGITFQRSGHAIPEVVHLRSPHPRTGGESSQAQEAARPLMCRCSVEALVKLVKFDIDEQVSKNDDRAGRLHVDLNPSTKKEKEA